MTKAAKTSPDLISAAAQFADHGMSMDTRHAAMIGDFIKALPPCDIVEIGCYHGISTAEILTAAKAGVTLIDYPRFQHNVLEMAKTSGKKVAMGTSMGLDFLMAEPSFKPGTVVVLDGDHRKEVVLLELAACLTKGITRFVLHDVANPAGDCDGPAAALSALQRGGFFIAIDQQARPGERTDRGLAICCQEAADHMLAVKAIGARN